MGLVVEAGGDWIGLAGAVEFGATFAKGETCGRVKV